MSIHFGLDVQGVWAAGMYLRGGGTQELKVGGGGAKGKAVTWRWQV